MIEKENKDVGYKKKWVALNIARFFGVFAMVFVHAHIFLFTGPFGGVSNINSFYYKLTSSLAFMGLFVTFLPVIAGAVLRMDFYKYIINGRLKGYKISKVVKVAIFISLLGFFMNAFTWGADYFFVWNILQLVGVSFIVIAILSKLFSIRAVFLLGIVSLFIASPLKSIIGSNRNYLINIFVGSNDYSVIWAFFPWFSAVAFGFLFSHYYLKYKNSIKFKIGAMITGLSFMLIAILTGEISPFVDPKYVWGNFISHQSIGWVLASIGLFLIVVILSDIFFKEYRIRKYGIINSYSKGILWIYIVQMFVSYKLADFVKHYFNFNVNKLSYLYFVFLLFMFLLSWLVGFLSIKLLQERKLVITLKKTNTNE